MLTFSIDPNQTTPFPHYWEMCIGSCCAYTALREDYRIQLKKAHDELGFKYVRFHGLLDDRMSVLLQKTTHQGTPLGLVYNFVNIDNIFDWLLDHDMKPFIELGFMPTAIAKSNRTVFHYKSNISPPANYAAWEELIHLLVSHLVDRYGLEEVKTWFFEVWNEPNLFFFFDGNQSDYFKLYESTARTIKKINQQLKVGGPATSCNSWIKETVDFCTQNNVPLDFISTHHYPTDDPLWTSGMDILDFFKSEHSKTRYYHRGVLQKMTQRVRAEAGKLPVYFTEWNTSAMTNDDQHDEPYAAAMVAKTLVDNEGLVDGYSFWTFSDIFEESGQLAGFYHGGFGLQNYFGVAKPTYRLFQLFHGLGDTRLGVTCNTTEGTVEMVATKTQDGYRFIAYNHNIPDEPINEQTLTIDLANLGPISQILLYRIDDHHANAKAVWQQAGAPEYPKRDFVKQLHEASELVAQQLPLQNTLSLLIPPHGVIAIDLVM